MTKSSEILNRKFYRESKAREEAERLLEEKSLELFEANKKLKEANEQLENLVEDKSTKLTEKEYEYKTLVESISDIICRTKLDGTITFINPIVTEITGYKPDEIIGTNILNYIVPEKRSLASRYFFRQFLNRRCLSYNEFEISSKSSKRIWVGLNVQFIEEKCASCESRICALTKPQPILQSKSNCKFKEIIVVARNITRQKQTEELLIKQSRNLEAGFKQQEILSEIAIQLNMLDDFSNKMNNFLKKIGEHLNVSRVYIFEDSTDGLTTSNTHEWCNIGVLSQKKDLQDIQYSTIPSWAKILNTKGVIYSESISELPDDLKSFLVPQGIRSIIVYPLYVQNAYFGFIGLDECEKEKKWQKPELELLKTLSGIISNAFERRISEKSLKESEEKNSAILSSIPDILLHLEKNGSILGYHSASQNTIKLLPDNFLNNKVTDIFPDEFGNRIVKAIKKCLQSGLYKFNYEIEIKGEEQHLELRMSKINNNEVIAIVRDVSERIRYENELTKERDRANNANMAKSEFLANMSHEIRTPMNAILGFSEALYDRIENQQNKKMLKSVLSSGKLLLSLINDILDLSKIEADKLEIKLLPTDLKNVLEDIKILFAAKASKKELPININIDKNFPSTVLLDEVRIKQIIFNLVGNAIKFTNKGYINICLNLEKKSENTGTVILTVEDTGIGIPESEHQVIFDAFRQQSGQSNRKYEGTGLGLSISKRLTEKMGGTLSVVSEVKKGSLFKLEIPDIQIIKNYNTKKHKETSEVNSIVFFNSTILVVDDIKNNIEITKGLLSDKQLNIISAKDGETALDMLKTMKPDLILLDILMPGIDGIEVARQIRGEESKKKIPIIAFTASAITVKLDINVNNLFDGILYKPITKSSLIKEFKKFLKHKIDTNIRVPDEFDIFEIPKNFPVNVKINLPEICEIIDNKLLPLWHNVKDSFVLYRIDNFIKEIDTVSKQYQIDFLHNYANRLNEDMEIVDLESLKSNLDKFSDLVNKLKQVNNHN